MTEVMGFGVLTWAEIVEHCSRIHTTRTRRHYPAHLFPDNDEMREDSRVLNVWIRETAARVVPTGLHEPGFYVSSPNTTWPCPGWGLRDEEGLAMFHRFVDFGYVRRRGTDDDTVAAVEWVRSLPRGERSDGVDQLPLNDASLERYGIKELES